MCRVIWLLGALGLLAAGSNANAGIIINGDVANGTGTLTITQDLSFNITQASTTNFINLVFDEWTISDGVRNIAVPSPNSAVISLNGGANQSQSLIDVSDNLAFTANDITPNDGLFAFHDPNLAAGDNLVIRAGSWTLSVTPGFNPLLNNSVFSGAFFLADRNGILMSDVIRSDVIPEPTSLAIFALGGLGLVAGGIRRRKQKQA